MVFSKKQQQQQQPAALLDVPALVRPMQELHDSAVNHSYAWRRTQLLAMQSMLKAARADLLQAIQSDLGRHPAESIIVELAQIDAEVAAALSGLWRWMLPRPVPTPGIFLVAFSWITQRPLTGPACLVIGGYNYPSSLVLQPTIGALAAGNPVVIKPSEQCPATAAVLQRYCHQYFEPSAVRVVTGGIPETSALIQRQPWGKICFTGSQRVGRLVAAAAAQTLTPCLLELGGKCPAVVDETCTRAFLKQAANRIIWAKTINAGQTCVSVDTLIVHQSLVDPLIPHLLAALQEQHGSLNPGVDSKSFPRMATRQHAERLVRLIQNVEQRIAAAAAASNNDKSNNNDDCCRIVSGGSEYCRPAERYVCPTLVLNPPTDCMILQQEIFGPVLPIVVVKSRQEALEFIRNTLGRQQPTNNKDDDDEPSASLVRQTPLALYVYTTDATVLQEYQTKCPAGAVVRNDCMVHVGSMFLPFGGLGTSGYGRYHGKYSFQAFSHEQPVLYRPCAAGLDAGLFRGHPIPGILDTLLHANAMNIIPDVPVLHLSSAWTWIVAAVVVGVAYQVVAAASGGGGGGGMLALPAILRPVGRAMAQQLMRLAVWLQDQSGGGGGSVADDSAAM